MIHCTDSGDSKYIKLWKQKTLGIKIGWSKAEVKGKADGKSDIRHQK